MRLIKRIFIITISLMAVLALVLFLVFEFYIPPLSERHGNVDSKLFVGSSDSQPLIVAFGGSQGGNTWTEEYWAEMRHKFIEQGYAVLSIGYFNSGNTPEKLDRISLNAIYDTIIEASKHPKINSDKMALLGSSRGGELVLNLASRYEEFDAVVALVPSHVSLPASTFTGNTSSWTFNGKEVEYVKIPYKAGWTMLKGDWPETWEIILSNEGKSENSVIEVEKIKGSVLLLSAQNDDIWPSYYMSEKVVNRLNENKFKYHYQHFSFTGSHFDTKTHFDVVFQFLDEHFKVE